MQIDRYISGNRIVDLSSKNLVSAYSELLDTFSTLLPTPGKRKKVLKELIDREKSLSSYLGEGVALPHARVSMKRPYALAIGRCPTGLAFEGKDSYEDVRFVFLLLASEKAKNYLSFLAALAHWSSSDQPSNMIPTCLQTIIQVAPWRHPGGSPLTSPRGAAG